MCGNGQFAKMSEDYKTAHTKTAGEQLTYQNKAEGVHSVNHECSDVSLSHSKADSLISELGI
jgi:hypothetical protein